ncbi:hypothetical protein D0Y65_030350 [Glycine soja]|uniref:Uncharacterized protein n=1 Tax=Glycine soja TaxID=3848 RepID=A0A445I3J1_GLYSO|nr:hypothetical protein D0Y65_030350 [Glycine soja]
MPPPTTTTLNIATFTFTEPNCCQGAKENTAPKREKREEECATMAALNQNGMWNIFGGPLNWDDRSVVADDPHFEAAWIVDDSDEEESDCDNENNDGMVLDEGEDEFPCQ